jgi:hypothetical protein
VGGIDVHKKQVTVTARTLDPKRAARWETTRTFRAFYGELLAMSSWLVVERGVYPPRRPRDPDPQADRPTGSPLSGKKIVFVDHGGEAAAA